MNSTVEPGRPWLARVQRPGPGTIALLVVALAVAIVSGWLWLRPAEFETPILGIIPVLVRGLPVTITLTVLGSALAAVVALLVGVARTSQSALVRGATGLYVEFFRGTSILVQMFWIYFVLPSPPFNVRLTAMQAGVLAMVRILPPFGNLLIELLKATSLASLITLADITFQGRLLIQSVGRMGEVFLVLLVIYFLLAYPLSLAVRWVERQRRWQ
jgi:polar amino acid transport system permease protein